jgi:hypothetical protein
MTHLFSTETGKQFSNHALLLCVQCITIRLINISRKNVAKPMIDRKLAMADRFCNMHSNFIVLYHKCTIFDTTIQIYLYALQ